ncbi:MAG: PLDc N-terminal domain-containing protein [Proteobacteria bacterium]|nr:PLDc N-terminal domain-containing protein [Pseudomonadota bacterium]MBU4010319.1 PLDc N-terminal domain-containing protein [Pseudomonadota bacterium]MBU4037436.1 PLDc N-terminal domain-containing protein [Pseudomonadota bacterium]
MAKIIIGTGLVFLLLTWWAVIDVSKKNFGSTAAKAIWGFTALVPFLGPLIYFAIGYRKGKKIQENSSESSVLDKSDG